MSDDKRVIQASEVLDVQIGERELPGGRPGVSFVLQIETRTGGVNEIDLILSPDLAVQHGTALAALGTALGGK